MNRLKGSLAAKSIAIILLAASCLVLCAAVFGIYWLDSEGAYRDKSLEGVREELIEKRLQITCFDLLDRMLVYPVSSTYDSTVRFELLDKNGKVLAGNLNEDESVVKTHIVQVDGYLDGVYFTNEDLPLTTHDDPFWTYDPSNGLSVRPVVTPTPTPVPVPTLTPEQPYSTSVPSTAVTHTLTPEPADGIEESTEAVKPIEHKSGKCVFSGQRPVKAQRRILNCTCMNCCIHSDTRWLLPARYLSWQLFSCLCF